MILTSKATNRRLSWEACQWWTECIQWEIWLTKWRHEFLPVGQIRHKNNFKILGKILCWHHCAKLYGITFVVCILSLFCDISSKRPAKLRGGQIGMRDYCRTYRSVRAHYHCEVGEMVALTPGAWRVRLHHPAAFRRPRPTRQWHIHPAKKKKKKKPGGRSQICPKEFCFSTFLWKGSGSWEFRTRTTLKVLMPLYGLPQICRMLWDIADRICPKHFHFFWSRTMRSSARPGVIPHHSAQRSRIWRQRKAGGWGIGSISVEASWGFGVAVQSGKNQNFNSSSFRWECDNIRFVTIPQESFEVLQCFPCRSSGSRTSCHCCTSRTNRQRLFCYLPLPQNQSAKANKRGQIYYTVSRQSNKGFSRTTCFIGLTKGDLWKNSLIGESKWIASGTLSTETANTLDSTDSSSLQRTQTNDSQFDCRLKARFLSSVMARVISCGLSPAGHVLQICFLSKAKLSNSLVGR